MKKIFLLLLLPLLFIACDTQEEFELNNKVYKCEFLDEDKIMEYNFLTENRYEYKSLNLNSGGYYEEKGLYILDYPNITFFPEQTRKTDDGSFSNVGFGTKYGAKFLSEKDFKVDDYIYKIN